MALAVSILDTLDNVLRKRILGLADLDRYALSQWKVDVERLRVELLNVKLDITVTDSILAPRQVMFVYVAQVDSSFAGPETRIQFSPFPATGWLVDLKGALNLPVAAPQEFRFLSPEKLPFNYPMTGPGLHEARVRYPFSYVLYHIGKTKETTYIAQGESPLRYAPVRTFELMTPDVVYGAPENIRLRAFSASRDPGRGALRVTGSSCAEDSVSFSTTGKDEWADTTFRVRWTRPPGGDVDTIALDHPQARVAAIRVHVLKTLVDSGRRIGMVPRIPGSPLALAVSRVAQSARIIAPERIARELDSVDVLVLDRGAWDEGLIDTAVVRKLALWVEAGGRLVVFPQSRSFEFLGIGFDPVQGLGPEEPLIAARGGDRLSRSFELGSAEIWENWRHARAWAALRGEGLPGADLILADRASKIPVVADVRVGAGTVCFVALNIEQQTQVFHLGALRLLANVLAP
jgi:hypothetical protein